jgi:DNA-binding transcriptional MocR family regulator
MTAIAASAAAALQVSIPAGIAHSALELGLLQGRLRGSLLPGLQAQARAMAGALRRHLPGCSFLEPRGGYFVWLALPEGVEAAQLLRRAAAGHSVRFLPGTACMGGAGCLRLSFAFYTVAEIEEGVGRLGRALREHLEERQAA